MKDRETMLKDAAELIEDGIKEGMTPEEIADNVLLSIDLMQRGVPAQGAAAKAIVSDLVAALEEAIFVIVDTVHYKHSGDPWEENAFDMGELDIHDYDRDGRLEKARAAIKRASLLGDLAEEVPQKVTTALPIWQQLQFGMLLGKMSDWRNEDHEDALTLSRSEVIAIVECVKELQSRSPAASGCQATLQNFNSIIAALRYDGPDENSLTVGEIRRALP